MSKVVFVSGFNGRGDAEAFAKAFQAYHNERHHLEGKSLFEEQVPEGHLVNLLGACARGETVSIPLFSSEPRSHAYETIEDAIEILRRIDPNFANSPQRYYQFKISH